MNVLLSIKPKYVEKIKKGTKKYEFRKSLFSKENQKLVRKIFIYSSSPVKKIVARFFLDSILEDHPKELWKQCKEYAGIDEREYFNYYKGKERGVALKISKLKFFKEPIDPHEIFSDFRAPQSFQYVEDIEAMKDIN